MAIDPKLPIPVYFQLKTLLIEEILEGDYGLDGRLPTEHQLCERHGISRTPVTRALSELATEGVVIRHRRRGTFVNPHWLHGHRGGPELRVIVPEGPWEGLIRRAAPADTRFSVATVELQELHQALTHAVAEGLGPDLAVLDSVWVPEFTAAGFLAPLEELDEGWVTTEYEQDFLAPLTAMGRTQGRTFAVHAEADVAGLWYRRAALEELGLEPPATWAELLAAGRALARAGGRDRHPVVLPGGSKAGEATTYVLLALLASNRAAVLEAGVVVLDGPATIEALTLLRELVVDEVMPVEVVAFEWDRPIRLLAHGSAAICLGGSYEGPRLAKAAGLPLSELWDHFGFAPVPGGPRGAPATLACGGGEEGGQPPPPGEASGEIRVVSNWTGSEGEAFQAVIDAFEQKYPKVTVKVEQVPFDQTQALLTQQFAAGSPPDVAVALPGIVRTFADQDLLLNLDAQWDTWIKDGAYTDALRQIASGPDGKAYAVYFKGNVNALVWYSPKQLQELGIGVPATWAEFTAAMDKAKAEGVAPLAVGGKDGWPLTQWTDPIILRVAGAEAFNDLARGKIGWDDPRIVKSFQVLGELIGKYFPPQALATGFIDETCARADGKFLFQNQGAFINLIVPAECDKSLKPGKDFTFFLMPKFDAGMPDAQFVSGDLFVGAKDTKNEAATLALLDYLASAEAQEIWAKRGGYIAPNAKVPAEAYPDENDRKAAALWPKSADVAAGYDLDDWIGGEIQVKYRQALAQFTRDRDVDKFIAAMTQVDTRAKD